MFVIDGHVHVGAWLVEGFAGRSTTLGDAEALYRRHGFHGALVMPTDEGDNQGLHAGLRALDASRDVLPGGGRVGGFRLAWWVDPSRPDAVDRLEAALDDVAALKIHPSFLRRPVTDEAFAPFLRVAARAGLPVVVHCGRWQEVAGFGRSLDAGERHPDVRFVLSHMGGDEPLLVRGAVAGIRERGLTNVWLGTESVRQYWVVQEAVDALGADRVIFGSDYNLNHPAAFRAVVEALALTPSERARILGGNLNDLVPSRQRWHTGDVPDSAPVSEPEPGPDSVR